MSWQSSTPYAYFHTFPTYTPHSYMPAPPPTSTQAIVVPPPHAPPPHAPPPHAPPSHAPPSHAPPPHAPSFTAPSLPVALLPSAPFNNSIPEPINSVTFDHHPEPSSAPAYQNPPNPGPKPHRRREPPKRFADRLKPQPMVGVDGLAAPYNPSTISPDYYTHQGQGENYQQGSYPGVGNDTRCYGNQGGSRQQPGSNRGSRGHNTRGSRVRNQDMSRGGGQGVSRGGGQGMSRGGGQGMSRGGGQGMSRGGGQGMSRGGGQGMSRGGGHGTSQKHPPDNHGITPPYVKAEPYRTDHLYDCPTNGPIMCTVCEMYIPSYSIAVTHFNSPKHHRKRMHGMTFGSDRRKTLTEQSSMEAYNMECVPCRMKPGSIEAYFQHMASPKHLRRINDIAPDVRVFDIRCEPCNARLTNADMLSSHCKVESHLKVHKDAVAEQFPDVRKAFQFYCETCEKACNSVMTFDAHCNSQRHKNRVKEANGESVPEQEVTGKRRKLVAVVPETVDELFKCKICVFSSSEKLLIDKHYETASHKANKLLKRRYDELYRVADVAKSTSSQLPTQIIPLNESGPHYCEVCDLYFSHEDLVGIHVKGRLHKDLEVKLLKAEAAAAEPAPTSENIPGYHCNTCNVHTLCLTVYVAHVSSSEHRKKTGELGEVKNPVLRGTALQVTDSEEEGDEKEGEGSVFNEKKKKKKKKKKGLGPSDAHTVTPKDGIPSDVLTDDGRFHCKFCNVYVHQKQSYLQHCRGRRHLTKCRLPAAESGGDESRPTDELFFCAQCSVSCSTQSEITAHLSSDEHNNVRQVPVTSDDSKEGAPFAKAEEMAVEITATPATTLFFCSVCQIDCRSQSAFQSHMDGIKHLKKSAKLTLEASRILDNNPNNFRSAAPSFNCTVCEVYCKSKRQLDDHLESFKHKARASLVHVPNEFPMYRKRRKF